jgi:cytochrome c-type biogenesis protein CcmF
MFAVLGNAMLAMSLLFGVFGIIIVSLSMVGANDYRFLKSGRMAFLSSSALVVFSTIILVYELMISNFSIIYVAKYTSIETPLLYKFTGLWAGMEGSLLFWLAIQSFFFILVILQNRKKHPRLMPWVMITMAVIQMFFLILINFFENPFDPVQKGMVVNGQGLNPLLQHWAMVLHPPALYLGFIGFSVPFAFAMAAIITKNLDAVWIQTTRRWTLITWVLLTIAIIMGGKWAYVELGWGGYWAWDPVENASLLPWLTATAYLHSVLIQEKKNMLRLWNMILIMLTFTLTIFGTYLTRSGIVSSVHAFAATDLGIWFFGFIILIIVVNAVLLIIRRKELESKNKLESFVSRESGFLFNNMLFISMMLAVIWGTMYPIFSEAVTGFKITVGSPYFNRIMIPLGLITLALTGIGPLLAWRKTSIRSLKRNFILPIVSALLLTAIIAVIMDLKMVYPLVSIGLMVFVSMTILSEFYRGMKARMRMTGEGMFKSLFTMIDKNRSRYGGYIVHVGIIMMFAGFTGKAFDKEADLSMMPGDIQTLSNYEITYVEQWFESPDSNPDTRSNHVAKIVKLDVKKNGKKFHIMEPEKRFYTDQNNQPHSEVAVKTTLNEDFYIVLGDVDLKTGLATMKVRINPMVTWVWLGTFVLLIGTMVSINIEEFFRRKTK